MAEAPKKPRTSNVNVRNKREKRCLLCVRHISFVDYKNVRFLSRYLSNFARILPRRITGTCAKHQSMVEQGMKRARFVGLMPYTMEHRMPEGKGV